ncbi:MAG TPA: hypothetical protein VFJ82_14665 [Longimicrobium sp.]|nr:hypothetical protein [Longimicrobium sp.]
MRLRTTILLAALVLAGWAPLSAQEPDTAADAHAPVVRSRPGWSLRRTMRAFLREAGMTVLGFFPTRGEWDYVTETRYRGAGKVVGIHRFSAAQTRDAIERPDGPLCNMFSSGDGVVFPSVVGYAIESPGWRRVGPRRFQPSQADDRIGVWVEWKREDGRWVIAAIGEWATEPPRVLGTPVAQARDTVRGRRLSLPLPPGAKLAPDAPWYQAGRTLQIEGPPYLRVQLTQKFASGRLVSYATVDGVTIWTEREQLQSSWGPNVVYVPIDRDGTFQVYDSGRGNGCN